jgi:20S proteasome alpha/beta subunit
LQDVFAILVQLDDVQVSCVPISSIRVTVRYSPQGKLIQIEYALNAVSAGTTSIGIKGRSRDMALASSLSPATNGAVIATEKKMPSVLVDETTMHKAGISDA